MHKEQIVGLVGKKSYQFGCDANGIDATNGTIQGDAGSRLHVMYPEQACLCMGVASVLLNDYIEEG